MPIKRHKTLILISLVASLSLPAQIVRSTVGFAEWQVYTPGGNLILHADGWKETYGDCLKADDADTASFSERNKVYVSHLKRWQYYKGYVAGENRKGFFLFNEANKKVTNFTSEQALLEAIAQKGLGKPTSNWLTSIDGWTEAWYPMMVWKPCKQVLSQTNSRLNHPALSSLSQAECRQALAKETLMRYRETTWGRECRRFKAIAPAAQRQQPDMKAFCEEILETRSN